MQFENLENKRFGIDNAEPAAAFIKRWWKVDPEVLDYVQCRPRHSKQKSTWLRLPICVVGCQIRMVFVSVLICHKTVGKIYW